MLTSITNSGASKRLPRRALLTAVIALVAVAALSLSACAKSSGGGTGPGGTTVKIGLITTLTGDIAGAGQEFVHGAELAIAQANADNMLGSGTKIQLVEKEGAEDPSKSANVAAQFGSDSSITGMICCILSTTAGAVTPIAIKDKLPTDIYGATDANLAKPPYVIRTVTMPQPANAKLATSVAKSENLQSVAYGVMTDNDGIVSQAQAFKSAFDAAGVKDLGQVGTLSTQTDFTASATSLIQKNAQAIVVMGTQANAVGLIAALHSKGYKGQIISGEVISGAGVYKSQPAALSNVPFPVYFLASQATGQGKRFAQAYAKKYGAQPDDYAAQGYMAGYVMALGLKNAKDKTREGLMASLNKLKKIDNTIYGGPVTFSKGQMSAVQNIKIVHYTPPNGDLAPWTAPSGS